MTRSRRRPSGCRVAARRRRNRAPARIGTAGNRRTARAGDEALLTGATLTTARDRHQPSARQSRGGGVTGRGPLPGALGDLCAGYRAAGMSPGPGVVGRSPDASPVVVRRWVLRAGRAKPAFGGVSPPPEVRCFWARWTCRSRAVSRDAMASPSDLVEAVEPLQWPGHRGGKPGWFEHQSPAP